MQPDDFRSVADDNANLPLEKSESSNADDVSSSTLALRKIEQTSSNEIVQMTSSDGSVFFVRTSYLQVADIDSIRNSVDAAGFGGFSLSEEESEDVFRAAFAFSAERKALDYLGRCEQSRFGLTQKLLQKGFEKSSVSLALDRLESKNFLSDSRYASAWLRSHCMTKFQGKSRLIGELISRGIPKVVASDAVENFFSSGEENFDNPSGITEEEMCEKAYQKAVRQRKSGEKILKYLVDSGFPFKMAISTIKNHKKDD